MFLFEEFFHFIRADSIWKTSLVPKIKLDLGLELDMVEPAPLPLIDYEKHYDFCAFTPMQLKNFAKYMKTIKTVIVGGGRVSEPIKKMVQDKAAKVYETYGMTETVSHIAVKKINHLTSDDDGLFKTLPDITISSDERGCLVINAPSLSDETIVTNDIVKVHSSTSFEWIGRFDNVVNSGGIKLFPEEIEAKLRNKIEQQFFVSSVPDHTLGEKLILVLEDKTNNLNASVFDELEKFEKPKTVYALPKFIETGSGKIHRIKTLKKLGL